MTHFRDQVDNLGSGATPAGPRWHRFTLLPFIATASLIAVFLLGDAKAFVNSNSDEILGHAAASAGLTVAAAGVLLVLVTRRPRAELVMVAGAVLTMAFEGAQRFAPGRGVQLRDLFSGLGGVLIAALAIEIVLNRLDHNWSVGVLALGATVASLLLGLLLVLPTPRNVVTAMPDSDRCPPTQIRGDGERLIVGSKPIADNCIDTGHGGMAFLVPPGAVLLSDNGVLASSELSDLGDRIHETGSFTVRVKVRTGPEVRGLVLMLWDRGSGTLLYLDVKGTTLATLGPSLGPGGRSSTRAGLLTPDTEYVIEVAAERNSLRTSVDGTLVAQAAMSDHWLDQFRGEALQLLVGNDGKRSATFSGTIEWIEIEAG